MKPLEYVLSNDKEVLAFLKTQYPLYHLSNVFFRDVQYGIQMMFERRGEKVGYQDAEKIARSFVEKLTHEKLFTPIDRQSWVLNYPEYKTVATKPSAPAKPAPGAAPAKSPAASRPSLPPLGGAKPALPPLSSAKPASILPADAARAKHQASAVQTEAEKQAIAAEPVVVQPTVEAPKPAAPVVQNTEASPAPPPPGQRKPLPPLRGNYTPAGKK